MHSRVVENCYSQHARDRCDDRDIDRADPEIPQGILGASEQGSLELLIWFGICIPIFALCYKRPASISLPAVLSEVEIGSPLHLSGIWYMRIFLGKTLCPMT